MNIDELKYRELSVEGLKTLMTWAKEEGWNPGPYDADVFYETDPQGFVGYYYNNVLIAGGSIVSYNGDFGFMGLFIVKPAYRSNGIGRALWYQRRNMLLSRLKEGATIGMDGVVEMQSFYKQGGFNIAFRDERHERKGEAFEINEHISSIDNEDISAILDYDKECFGYERPQFMKPWLEMEGSKTFKYKLDGQLKGFAVVRKLQKGYKVCPLFAENAAIAEELYKACLNVAIGSTLMMDIPVTNTEAVDLMKKYDANYIFECARMYHGTPPDLPINKIFGITTFELG